MSRNSILFLPVWDKCKINRGKVKLNTAFPAGQVSYQGRKSQEDTGIFYQIIWTLLELNLYLYAKIRKGNFPLGQPEFFLFSAWAIN